MKEVLFEGVTAGDKDFSALVARLKKENVDFVYFGGYYPEMGQILRRKTGGAEYPLYGAGRRG